MGLYINSLAGNLSLVNSLYRTSSSQINIIKRLASGIKINSASDDAAGLALAEKLSSGINGNTVAQQNVQEGLAYLNIADSALGSMTDSLLKIRDLAVQSANGVYTASERDMMQKEVSQLSASVAQAYESSKFCDKRIFGGDTADGYAAAIAAGYDADHIITSANDFVSNISSDLSGSFVLAGNIDMISLGTLNNSAITGVFTGTLEGNGKTISNLTIDTLGASITDGIGLFSDMTGGTIQNIALQNVNITALDSNAVGSFSGFNGYMNNCQVSNATITVGDDWAAGVLTGGNYTPYAITNCSATASSITAITGTQYIGGLVGYQGGTISNSYSSVDIFVGDNSSFIGGLTGDVNNDISSCYATGSITVGNNSSDIGGFGAGMNPGNVIDNSYSDVNITAGANANAVGGFISRTAATGGISNSYATGSINVGAGSTNIKGFSGMNTSIVDNTNFYQNNISSDALGSGAINENILPDRPQLSWDSGVWDLSSSLPTLRNCGATLSTVLSPAQGASSAQVQAGADANSNSRIEIGINFLLGDIFFDVSSQSAAQTTLAKIDAKTEEVNTHRSYTGATANKLQSALGTLDSRITNLAASKSTIYDSDIAKESADLVKSQIRTQSSIDMLQQIKNLDSSLVMSLLNSL